jgi:hypothetical protein
MEKLFVSFQLKKKLGNTRTNIILRRIRITIVAGDKQLILLILSVCL